MCCCDGRTPALYVPRFSGFFIDSLYGTWTRRLFASGRGLRDRHHTRVQLSFTRTRSTLTYCTGVGSRAGLWTTNS